MTPFFATQKPLIVIKRVKHVQSVALPASNIKTTQNATPARTFQDCQKFASFPHSLAAWLTTKIIF
jgi:hypothetical protein